MMRVLTLSSLYPNANRPELGRFVERQTQGLAALDDVEVLVVAPRGLPPGPLARLSHYRPLADLAERETWNGIDVHRPRFTNWPMTGGRHHAASIVRAVQPLLAAIRRDFPFDVIDAEFFFPDGPAAVALARTFGVPVSIKARGADIHHWGHAPGTAGQVRAAGRAADGLLSVSGALADDMAAIGMPRDRIRIHRTGIDHSQFAADDRPSARAALGVATPLVVSVGALIPRKGHDIVIDAVARLPGVALWIAGSGPEQATLEARIAGHGAGDRIRLLGQMRHADLPRLFAAADVMALASSSEGLANVWVEAMAAGTPVVIPPIGGADEAVDRPAAGRIAARDAGAFAQAIGALIADPPPADAVRAAAARFSWDRNAAELRDHLAALVAAHRARAAA